MKKLTVYQSTNSYLPISSIIINSKPTSNNILRIHIFRQILTFYLTTAYQHSPFHLVFHSFFLPTRLSHFPIQYHSHFLYNQPLFSNSFPTQIPSSTSRNDFFSISSFILEWMKIQKKKSLKNITKQEIVLSRIGSMKKRFASMIM